MRACTLRTALLSLFVLLGALPAYGGDKLVILSPHRKSIQDEVIPLFKDFYKSKYGTEVEIDWLDQGGTSDDVRFVKSKFAKNAKTSGIDLFWGGGTATFLDLNGEKILAPFKLPAALAKEVPPTAAGVPLYNKDKTWIGTAMSSFGIFFNKKLLQMDKLPEPKSWSDLADPKFINQLSLTDPRRSGTAATMNNIVLESMGWDKGWQMLSEIAGNTNKFTYSSSDPIKAVVSGDAAASMVIDFYALPKVLEIGPDNLGFTMPSGQTILDPDPIAILKGAPNSKTAERFVEFVLSPEVQKLWLLPVGQKDGPKLAPLGRMAVNTVAYEQTEGRRLFPFNPFKEKAYLQMDLDKVAKTQQVFNDLIGAIQIDTHEDLKTAWKAIIKRGSKPAEVAEFGKPPVTQAELMKLADKWDDNVFRNKSINDWVTGAKAKYAKLTNLANN
jgi:ABC-type Fe3+ transport system substrate-binding protein